MLKVLLCRSENLQISLSSLKKNMPKVSQYDNIYFFKLCAPEIYEMVVYEHVETIEYVKN